MSDKERVRAQCVARSDPREFYEGFGVGARPDRLGGMPITTIKIIEDIFTDEQKAQMIDEVTEAMVRVTGEEKRAGNWVLIEEIKSGDWAIGGKPVHAPPK